MDIKQLRYLVGIADEQHVGRAAERLHVTQPALSQQLRKLEEEIGSPLFERHHRGMRLTIAGQVMLKHARQILAQMEDARNEIDSLADTGECLVHIGTIQSMNFHLIPTAISRLQESEPNIHVRVAELSGSQLEDSVAKEKLDFGIGFLPTIREDLVTEQLFSENFYLAVHRSHPLAEQEVVDFKQLHGLSMALLTDRYISRRLFDTAALRASIRPKIKVETNTTASLLLIACVSQLAVVLPRAAIPEWIQSKVAMITLKNPTLQRSVGLIWGKNNVLTHQALSLAASIRDCFVEDAFCLGSKNTT
ncbi:LysR substrate-binding domain-containing protein [Teredinibacter turnerae]|uniref:Transcriptional regulator, LysR family n=1 Tax=Teredinibacter turnerae (strain ATCC 39867 / T7901) TaxID=377629 RepID=C5BQI4_TERTT|nr:LysR substrate-binding domain-containing protein [Teredinibacter turnerae]ACR13704.1 transcriptional regulator, LysR family [Teredinibacter turnerae T7901]